MLINILQKIVYTICLLYTVNIIISKIGKIIPINMYTILVIYFFDFFGIIAIIYLKYYFFGGWIAQFI